MEILLWCFFSLPKYTIDVVFGSHWLPGEGAKGSQARWGFLLVLEEQAVGSLRHLRCVQALPGSPASADVQLTSRINDVGTGLSYSQHCFGPSSFQCLGLGPDMKQAHSRVCGTGCVPGP